MSSEINRRKFIKVSGTALPALFSTFKNLELTEDTHQEQKAANPAKSGSANTAASVVSLPSGGGSLRGIGESFSPNPFTGTANFSVPIYTSTGRGEFGPKLSLDYSSGIGNSEFGMGWNLSLPNIRRKTDKGLPRYTERDTFILNGSDDLVERTDAPFGLKQIGDYDITTYRPRIEGAFAIIERWSRKRGQANPAVNDQFWVITTKENITSVYGYHTMASLQDPAHLSHIFQWNLEFTFDRKGNYMRYEFVEDKGSDRVTSLSESHRQKGQVVFQTYLKRIDYGNLIPFSSWKTILDRTTTSQEYFFSVIFDYVDPFAQSGTGVQNIANDIYQKALGATWSIRSDPFSSYRPSFEIRTYRLCHRVLMFHHIPTDGPTLIRSTDFTYRSDPNSLNTFLKSVTTRGYKKASAIGTFESEELQFNVVGFPGVTSTHYQIKSHPPVTFTYSKFEPHRQKFKPIEFDERDNPPVSLNNPDIELIDLFARGMPDILETTPYEFKYWKNLGSGKFSHKQRLSNVPAGHRLSDEGVGFADMSGNGLVDLLIHKGDKWGFYEVDANGGWGNFRPYKMVPSLNLSNANVRLLDITGNGRSDVMISRPQSFVVFPCLGGQGFGDPIYCPKQRNLEECPDVNFDDPRVQLADMTGDGMKDIVLVTSNRIDYWPALGYGRYAKRITMERSPNLGRDMDVKRMFLADISGNGVSDLIYVESGKIRFWFNQSGNGWSDEFTITGTPTITNETSIRLTDLEGSGTTGILWSNDFELLSNHNYFYLDLCGGIKPNMLVEMNNNSGSITKVAYGSSSDFFLADEKLGKKWLTPLPFPVQVLVKSELFDLITKSKQVTTYKYSHGYFDGEEREFRGFAAVEQTDTESFQVYNFPEASSRPMEFSQTEQQYHLAPVLTRMWHHTGMAERGMAGFVSKLESEFFFDGGAQKPGMAIEFPTSHETARALKGSVLRIEVYSEDNSPDAKYPFTVTANGYRCRVLQAQADGKPSVCHATLFDSWNYHFERNPIDPRVTRSIQYTIDELGNPLKTFDVAYGRRDGLSDAQQRATIVHLTETFFINLSDMNGGYNTSVPFEVVKKELLFSPTEFDPVPLNGMNNAWDRLINDTSTQKLISHFRFYYDERPLGKADTRCLPSKNMYLAIDQSQIATLYNGKFGFDAVNDPAKCGYSIDSGSWWLTEKQTKYDSTKFYVTSQQIDPLGNVTKIDYDLATSLIPVKIVDALGNETSTVFNNNVPVVDYSNLTLQELIDINGNYSSIELDPLGNVISTCVKGKFQNGTWEGDDNFTTRNEYNHFNFWVFGKPNYVKDQARMSHKEDSLMESVTYADGQRREIQKKILVEPGFISGEFANERWIRSGDQRFNNKGLVIQEFEPTFCTTNQYENPNFLGVFKTNTYDPLGRIVRTDYPDQSHSRIVINPWETVTWDQNDTCETIEGGQVKRSGWLLSRINSTDIYARQEGNAALAQARTPEKTCHDVLGRPYKQERILRHADGTDQALTTISHFDNQANIVSQTNPCGHTVFIQVFDRNKKLLHRSQMDSGDRTFLPTATGSYYKKWDARSYMVHTEYDQLNRPLQIAVTNFQNNAAPIKRITEKIIYGETSQNARSRNLRGKVYQIYDGAGVLTNDEYDFKGNVIVRRRQIAKEFKKSPDWTSTTIDFYRSETFTSTFRYDALNRVIESMLPDRTIIRTGYNLSNLLSQVSVALKGESEFLHYVKEILYNVRGDHERIVYGNELQCDLEYDELSFRIHKVRAFKNNKVYLDYTYYYDPVGNVVAITDKAHQDVFYSNSVVSPNREFSYDSLYRLTSSTGRKLLGLDGTLPLLEASMTVALPQLNDLSKVQQYTEEYEYDVCDNIIKIKHNPQDSSGTRWTRRYNYHPNSNQIINLEIGSNMTVYSHDAHGNLLSIDSSAQFSWDHRDKLVYSKKDNAAIYFLYDSNGSRVRKVVVYNNIVKERLYIDSVEIYREYASETQLDAANDSLHRDTLHVIAGIDRVAVVDTLLKENGNVVRDDLARYILNDHLGSAKLEIDHQSITPVAYEEFYAFGETSYRSLRSNNRFGPPRFRFNGKEKDENGLYNYGARMYIPWIGRWIQPDPGKEVDGLNLYCYARNNPIRFRDPSGLAASDTANEKPTDTGFDFANEDVNFGLTMMNLGEAAMLEMKGSIFNLNAAYPGKGEHGTGPSYDGGKFTYRFGSKKGGDLYPMKATDRLSCSPTTYRALTLALNKNFEGRDMLKDSLMGLVYRLWQSDPTLNLLAGQALLELRGAPELLGPLGMGRDVTGQMVEREGTLVPDIQVGDILETREPTGKGKNKKIGGHSSYVSKVNYFKEGANMGKIESIEYVSATYEKKEDKGKPDKNAIMTKLYSGARLEKLLKGQGDYRMYVGRFDVYIWHK